MNYFKPKSISIIIISIVIIISCAYFKSVKEGLTNNDNIILIGDSVLNNSNYVSSGTSVADILKTKTDKVFNFAKDGATISDCYGQLDKIPTQLNKTNTYVFISAGGNDILNKRGQLTNTNIIALFKSYMSFINALRARINNHYGKTQKTKNPSLKERFKSIERRESEFTED